MKKLKYLLFVVLLISFNNCKNDDLSDCITADPNCLTASGESVINFDSIIDLTLCIFSPDYVPLHRYEYAHPVFNPNNSNEVIYLREDYGTSGFLKQELMKYNFCSNEASLITDLALYGIDWSSKDWVIYTGYDQNLYKIKSNGDSLTQLTTNGQFNSWAKWNDSGTQYLYRQEGIGRLLIADERGEILDTLNNLYASNWSWDNNRIFFTAFTNGGTGSMIGEYDLTNKEMIVIDSTLNRLLGAIKYNESANEVVFLFGNEAFSFHSLTDNQVELRITGYDNRTYSTFDLSPDRKTIVCSRSNLTQVDACTIEGDQFLHLIDISGENERVLLIPE